MSDTTPKRRPGRQPGGPGNVRDRTGERYDRLVVVRRAEDRPDEECRNNDGKLRSRAQWLCVCDCGNYRVVSAYYLGKSKDRGTKSCGCSKYDPRPKPYNLKNPLPPGRAARNRVRAYYRGSARIRGFSWELTDEQFDEITSKDCTYCGCPPSNVITGQGRNSTTFTWNGIDRKNSALGYIPGNVLPCCSVCNNAKKDLSYDEFMAWIARLTEYHWFHPDVMPSRLLREVKESA